MFASMWLRLQWALVLLVAAETFLCRSTWYQLCVRTSTTPDPFTAYSDRSMLSSRLYGKGNDEEEQRLASQASTWAATSGVYASK